jgi:hypothetical protein
MQFAICPCVNQAKEHYNNLLMVTEDMETLQLTPYMERTEETSTGGPPSIVLMISITTEVASPLYC